MIAQLRKVNDEDALILDKPLLELLGLEENAQVQLTVQGNSLIVTPTHPKPVDRSRFNELLDQVVETRREVLQLLAQ
ncbi:MAG: hypothetical protein AB7U20_03055 [Planctomycetaceae bacterium]